MKAKPKRKHSAQHRALLNLVRAVHKMERQLIALGLVEKHISEQQKL